jgi:hypothetical protein
MSPHQAKQAVRVANVPADDFERQGESPTPPTITKLAGTCSPRSISPCDPSGGIDRLATVKGVVASKPLY